MRNALWTLAGVVGLAVLLMIVLVAYRWTDSKVLHSSQRGIDTTRYNAERSDCARGISNEQTAVKDRRDNLFADYVIATSDRDFALAASIKVKLRAAEQEVKDLKPTQKLVDKTCVDPVTGRKP